MHYKTIVLELLRDRPRIAERLSDERRWLPALDRCSTELKTRHQAWTALLTGTRAGDPSQLASEALEIAIRELEAGLDSGFSPTEDDGPSLDAAMAFLRRATPTG
jgi:hypothetical protein